jgi:hypothetical protein
VHTLRICAFTLFLVGLMVLASCALMSKVETEATDSSTLMPEQHEMIHESYEPEEFCSSPSCNLCHEKIFEQYADSMHAKSFSNPVFQAQYFREVLPRIKDDQEIFREANACIACHSPIEYLTGEGLVTSSEQVETKLSGVGCDVCHTMTGYRDTKPGNGNYVSKPGSQKYGPFKCKKQHHHEYSEFQTKSEFCAVCHSADNHNGLEIKSTYSEWKDSKYAEDGIQCQDCHMNLLGFLKLGVPEYESGKAALTTTILRPPFREKLYTHRFPGAHSRTQLIWSLQLAIETERSIASPGDEITIHVLVDNSGTGHKMPSGSAELRLLWIELKAYVGDETIPITINELSDIKGQSPYDVSGKGALDYEILKGDVPEGNRIYRAILVDKSGKQTLSSYDAVKIIFDNRLNAGEIRKETYSFKVPQDAKDRVFLSATLKYLPYPSFFTKRLGEPDPQSVEIASSEIDIAID